ncbi:hypothetical protein GOM49_10430 [Clostridium bovifaecis]|uniref:Uncharacterized protein n=1 Tax=Clostridium bovifaecis TaxID=2184719 RepID=A0A6I6F6J5_9CLOT|nr:hypothetical protein GOM49_10430 [Clostridium bovifaecis]
MRNWAPDHEKMGKGISLTVEELKKFRNILSGSKFNFVSQRPLGGITALMKIIKVYI